MSAVSSATPTRVAPTAVGESVLAALVGLGWSEKVAAPVVEQTLAEAGDADKGSVAVLLRLALGKLGPAQHTVGDRS